MDLKAVGRWIASTQSRERCVHCNAELGGAVLETADGNHAARTCGCGLVQVFDVRKMPGGKDAYGLLGPYTGINKRIADGLERHPNVKREPVPVVDCVTGKVVGSTACFPGCGCKTKESP